MAWIKIPKENHPILLAALPKDPRVRLVQMFGSTVGLVNGHLFGGLFARSAMVRLAPEHRLEALALDGAEPFDPMGNKRAMADSVLLPESVMDEPAELQQWLARAFEYTLTLPPKRRRAKRPAARKAPPRKAPPRKPRPRKAAAKRPTGRKPARRSRATSRG